ncbi:MAG TPA: UDP-N-acetylmuramoyl-L-alanyl-D-glutamate--2,6-diaminopimelate ligase [Casimicrobiaceae bacterium]|nr:UDP-N-acetylmuramoyl-L-alanyl-D-glutamate--2,6-diaminopimelate ligase [Casimicrobiaceae bacterium]
MTSAQHDSEATALLARLATPPRRITADSRRVTPGSAFAAYPGAARDGRTFIPDAIRHGAGAVFWESRGFQWNPRWSVPNVGVDDLRARLGGVADLVFGQPSRALWMIGVTGTNGKTSSAYWIAHAFNALGRRTGLIGTLGSGIAPTLSPSLNTTPEVCALHEMLAEFRAAGAHAVAMEASSHGIDQGRINGVKFDIALFTNLTRDHLDYHGTMAAYGAAKARLFTWPGLRVSVINADDPFGLSLVEAARGRGQTLMTYGLANADVATTSLAMSAEGIAMAVITPWGRGDVTVPMVGTFNALNLLGVLGVLLASDVALDDALEALATLRPPAGRMQRFGGGDKPLVVVDYAHTPDALEQVLVALRPAVARDGSLVCVFGCGGDRDPGKRPQMGRIAATLADRLVVTSDNPRSEDPAEIASAVVHGIRETNNRRWVVELDRATAIEDAVRSARPGDVILLAGKGHESYQETLGVRAPFSDAEHAARALDAWRALQ